MRIDRVVALTPDNLPFAFMAVGLEGIESIGQVGENFVGYDETGEKVFEILDFHNITVTYTKGE
jgi:hypothetical protein